MPIPNRDAMHHAASRSRPVRPEAVYFYGTCLIDLVQPMAGLAAVELIEREGVRVIYPQAQTCCGQPPFNAGYRREALGVAREQIALFPTPHPVVVQLLATGEAFHCDCSRAQLAEHNNIYQGHCRKRNLSADTSVAVRVLVEGETAISASDQLQDPLHEDVATAVGDFIIRRRDRLYAYQLAVVVDDAYQGINQLVRGSDLYDSTPRQIYLQQLLALPTPTYTHIPVITNARGQKLSKQTHAPALDDERAIDNLHLALRFLGQSPPVPHIQRLDLLLQHAVEHWQIRAVPACMGIPETSIY